MAIEAITPTVDEVAAQLPGRAKDGAGNILTTFTDATEPTAGQVTDLIQSAVNSVQIRVGVPEDEALAADAKEMATLKAATLVERHFFRQQVAAGQSTYGTLKAEYDDGMKHLEKAVREHGAGGDPDVSDDSPSPLGSFPPASGIETMGF